MTSMSTGRMPIRCKYDLFSLGFAWLTGAIIAFMNLILGFFFLPPGLGGGGREFRDFAGLEFVVIAVGNRTRYPLYLSPSGTPP